MVLSGSSFLARRCGRHFRNLVGDKISFLPVPEASQDWQNKLFRFSGFGANEPFFVYLSPGFYESLVTVFWVCMILLCVCYVIGVLFVITVGSSKTFENAWPEMPVYVGSVPRAMLTVFQVGFVYSESVLVLRQHPLCFLALWMLQESGTRRCVLL